MIALNQLQKLEIIQVAALASAYKYLALMKTAASMIGVGAAILAVAGSLAMLQSGTGPIPVGQTSAGTARQVSASGLAVIHAGETISRGSPTSAVIGPSEIMSHRPSAPSTKPEAGIVIHIHEANMSLHRDIEQTAEDLGTLTYEAMRRRRH
jgi:hypothetical protein